jgi:hypothetical protein
MPRHGDRKWWSLYLLAPLSAGLLYMDGRIHANLKIHEVLAMAVIVVLFGLTFYWTEKHADLMESEGVDARAPEIPFETIGVLITSPSVPPIPVGRPRRAVRSLPDVAALELDQADYLSAKIEEEEQVWQVSRN